MQRIGLFCVVSTFLSSPLWNIERRDPCCLANSLFLQSWHWETQTRLYTLPFERMWSKILFGVLKEFIIMMANMYF